MNRTTTMALVAALALAAVSAAEGATLRTVLHISSHLPKAAEASLDGGKPVRAPGEGSVNVPVTAGHHTLTVTTATGATYKTDLDLKGADLMTLRRKGYWCVNLLDTSLEVYSHDDCQEEVTDAG